MRAKQYLRQYKLCMIKLGRIEDQIQQLESKCLGVPSPQADDSRVQTSYNPDLIGETIAKMTDLKARLEREKAETSQLMVEIEETINLVSDEYYKALLEKHYIDMKTWEAIANEMNYSSRWILTMHGRALWEVEKILNDKTA